MAKKKKHLCKYDKHEIRENMQVLTSYILNPQFICEKCARSANTNEVLCKPLALSC